MPNDLIIFAVVCTCGKIMLLCNCLINRSVTDGLKIRSLVACIRKAPILCPLQIQEGPFVLFAIIFNKSMLK